MDRRDNPQTANGSAPDSLHRALDLIVESYGDGAPAELYREAVSCFDDLIDISRNTESVKEFAGAKGIDLKYLVDGANFVISKMHFNPEDNYYLTLGVPEDASPEVIKERWKRLMLLYHPDAQAENEEWFSERAKKVNEAYATLKDPSRRQSYDRRLWEHRYAPVFSSGPQPLSRNPAVSRAGSRQRSYEDWGMIRRYLPRLLIVLYILVASAFLGFIYYQNRSKHLEDELRPASVVPSRGRAEASPADEKRALHMEAPLRDGDVEKSAAAAPADLASGPDKDSGTEVAEKGPALPVITHAQKHGRPAKAKRRRAGVVKATHVPKPSSSASVVAGVTQVKVRKPKAVKTARPASSQVSSRVQEEASRGPETAEAAAAPPDVRSGGSPAPNQHRITKAEVEDFIKRYSAAYEKGDLKAFMPFFSSSATENNMNYDEIKRSYSETFEEKIGRHYLQHVDIKIEGKTADVSGIYNVVRFLSARNSWEHYRGNIHWKLARVNGALKIVRSHYDK